MWTLTCCLMSSLVTGLIWAATWQNQQNDCAPSEDSDQPGHPPSLIRVFAVRMKKAWVLSYPMSAQRRLWSDWADAQADLSLRWAHSHFVGFVMSRLISNHTGDLASLYVRDSKKNEFYRSLFMWSFYFVNMCGAQKNPPLSESIPQINRK